MREFSPSELKAYLDAGHEPVLLDVRETWEFEICALENARHVPMSQIKQACAELDQECTIIAICHHGIRSRFAARHLERLGFRDVINLAGGVEAWARDVDPEMPTY